MTPSRLSRLTRHPMAGIGFYIAGMASFSVMNALIRLTVTADISSLQIVFLRNVCSLLLMIPFAYFGSRADPRPRTTKLPLHFWRAAIGTFAMETWFYSLSLMPVNQATAIGFTSPLFATLFAVAFLGETAGPWRIGALAAGFLGTLIILDPTSTGGFGPTSFVVLFAASMMSVASIVVKRLSASEPAWRIVLYMSFFMTLLSAPFGLMHWHAIPLITYGHTFLIALCSTLAQLAMVAAFARASIVLLMPFDFTKLVFTAAIAWAILGERLETSTLIGAAVIVSSSVLVAWRERRKETEESALPSVQE